MASIFPCLEFHQSILLQILGKMGLSPLAALLLLVPQVLCQYGPIKAPPVRRTTTPFPPGFQSDNQLYNAESNSIAPESNQPSQSFSYKEEHSSLSGLFSSSGNPNPYFWANDESSFPKGPAPSGCGPNSGCGGAPSSGYGSAPSAPSAPSGYGGYGSAPSSNQKSPSGAASQPDNPWLSGIIAQNSGPSRPNRPSPSCGYGGCSSSSSSPQQQATIPTVPCTTPGFVCVPKYQCPGGETSSFGTGVSI